MSLAGRTMTLENGLRVSFAWNMGVSPKWIKMDDLGVPLFLETPLCDSVVLGNVGNKLVSTGNTTAVHASASPKQSFAGCDLVRLFWVYFVQFGVC